MFKLFIFILFICGGLSQDIKIITNVLGINNSNAANTLAGSYQYDYNGESTYKLGLGFNFSLPVYKRLELVLGYYSINSEYKLRLNLYDGKYASTPKVFDADYTIENSIKQIPIGLKFKNMINNNLYLNLISTVNYNLYKIGRNKLFVNQTGNNPPTYIDPLDLSADEKKLSYQFGIELDSRLYQDMFINIEFSYIFDGRHDKVNDSFTFGTNGDSFESKRLSFDSGNVMTINLGIKYFLSFISDENS